MLSNPFTDIFVGVIITSNVASNAVTVIRESYGADASPDAGYMMQGIVLSHTLATFLGFKQSDLPQPGSRVLCLSNTSDSCYIFGVIPGNSVDVQAMPNRAALGAGDALEDAANRQGHTSDTPIIYDCRRPTDVVDGEHVVSNEFGVLLGLYQQLANLKASELSQIQCHLLDDLVRIISHNFQHYTAIGEYNIYHDGKKLMAEFGATHKTAETYGRPAVYSDQAPPMFTKTDKHTVDDSQDFYEVNADERIKAIERFKLFLGSVGDFIHLFIARPDPQESRFLAPDKQPNKPDTGLADVHLGPDGGVHVRSVKEIFIEKTNWIRVPHRTAAPEDPAGDDAASLNYTQKIPFQFLNDFKYKANPFTYALQIRDYVAYVNEQLGYQNFKAHKKDFFVNDDINRENNLSQIDQVDQETPLKLGDYELRTAGIYIMPNGGITIRDAWNSAIVMEGGSIYLQPAKDLVAQPLRNNIVKAGGNISMTSKKQIDLSSTTEGLRLKSLKAMCLYSDASGIVLESNNPTDGATGVEPDARAIENLSGIVLKSKTSIYNYTDKDIVAYANKRILFQSVSNFDIVADEGLTLYSKKQAYLLADTSALIYGKKAAQITSDATVIAAGANGTLLGQKDQNIGVMYDSKSPFVDVIKGVVPVGELTKKYADIEEAKAKLLKYTMYKDADKLSQVKFKFPSTNQYGGNLQATEDALPSTLAQQDDLLTNLYGLTGWKELEINGTLPYPGKELFDNFYVFSGPPKNLQPNTISKDYANVPTPKNEAPVIQLTSLQNFKIQP